METTFQYDLIEPMFVEGMEADLLRQKRRRSVADQLSQNYSVQSR